MGSDFFGLHNTTTTGTTSATILLETKSRSCYPLLTRSRPSLANEWHKLVQPYKHCCKETRLTLIRIRWFKPGERSPNETFRRKMSIVAFPRLICAFTTTQISCDAPQMAIATCCVFFWPMNNFVLHQMVSAEGQTNQPRYDYVIFVRNCVVVSRL